MIRFTEWLLANPPVMASRFDAIGSKG